jgi:hypothetical protein
MCLSVRPPARMEQLGFHEMKFDIWVFFENLSIKFNIH